ncbi:uncharacterized protein K460DRAFT_66640 [Cucurbitaria berberidis CBS 394.84]|uniref:Uncharacterized protein n=1 Tax=Cucurbitaria berberidis CBS 394.84 TaxID=1168544 RepID=A0A9P4LB39_9PLEO|nr:uncharacterized protein K460DRAFT_66640 [Cucurbitaria berberidis CBS 394.84]KAF1847987.1 hypothetical protein K460DRAFT_66640 [Cucurbitaria berberidis CBS 394.84]
MTRLLCAYTASFISTSFGDSSQSHNHCSLAACFPWPADKHQCSSSHQPHELIEMSVWVRQPINARMPPSSSTALPRPVVERCFSARRLQLVLAWQTAISKPSSSKDESTWRLLTLLIRLRLLFPSESCICIISHPCLLWLHIA